MKFADMQPLSNPNIPKQSTTTFAYSKYSVAYKVH